LLPVDRQLAGVRGLASSGRPRLGFGQLDAHAAQIRFDLGEPRRRDRFFFARVR
jgi:hypothetical protein